VARSRSLLTLTGQQKTSSKGFVLSFVFSFKPSHFFPQFLEQDPAKRLGSGPSGSDDVKNHPYFSDVDWAALERKEIVPPYKPKVSNEMDLSHIDPVFTSEAACDSLVEKSVLGGEQPNQFDGFTFVPESELSMLQ
jgi:Protein kinase C terminal domain